MSAGYSLLLFGVLLNASAQLLLKAGTNAVGRFEFAAHNIVPVATRVAVEPHIVAGMLCYAVSLVVWIMGLSRVPVSVAYPLLSLGYVVNALGAWLLLGEPFGAARLAGVALIVAGVWVIARS
jgi:drug/metabolite transporter (DMT)-like permease